MAQPTNTPPLSPESQALFNQTPSTQGQQSQPTSSASQLSPESQRLFEQTSGDATTSTANGQPAPYSDEIQIQPSDNLATKAAKGVGSFLEGAGEGVFKTAAGASDLVDRVAGMQRGSANKYLHHLAGDDDATHGTAQLIGQGGEDIAEFLTGDALLTKALSYGAKLRKVASLVETLEQSPKLVNVLKAAGISFGQSEVKTGGDTRQSAETALLTGGTAGILSGAATGVSKLVNTIRAARSLPEIQPLLQQGVRSALDTVASDVGVQPSPSSSIRDVAKNIGDAIHDRSKAAYKALDDATGGRFQRYEDALKNINNKLRETAGLDDEAEEKLMQRKAEVEQSQHETFEAAKAGGVNPNLVDTARADWKQAHSLYDLDRQIKMASSGMRPELAKVGAEATPERLSPEKIFTRLNRLYDSGRLQQAVGDEQAKALLQYSDNAFLSQAKALDAQKTLHAAGKTAKHVALGALGIEGAAKLFDLTK